MPTYPIDETDQDIGQNGRVLYSSVKTGVRRYPIDRATPLPYDRKVWELNTQRVSLKSGTGPWYGLQHIGDLGYLEGCTTLGNPEGQLAYNSAYAGFKDQLGPSSELGTSIAEGMSSIQMVALRAAMLGRAFMALKRGDFRGFLRELRVRPLNKHRKTAWTRPRDASAIWLEYWMGWAPTVADIHATVEVLLIQYPPIKIVGKGSVHFERADNTGTVGHAWQIHESNCAVSARIEAKVRVINPNTYLAQQLGLINPAAIAWNVIPFSWLTGWAHNLSDVLAAWTDFAGLEISDASYTMFGRIKKSRHEWHYQLSGWDDHEEYAPKGAVTRRVVVSSLPLPFFLFKLPNRLSVTRGATAMALLATLFTKG